MTKIDFDKLTAAAFKGDAHVGKALRTLHYTLKTISDNRDLAATAYAKSEKQSMDAHLLDMEVDLESALKLVREAMR